MKHSLGTLPDSVNLLLPCSELVTGPLLPLRTHTRRVFLHECYFLFLKKQRWLADACAVTPRPFTKTLTPFSRHPALQRGRTAVLSNCAWHLHFSQCSAPGGLELLACIFVLSQPLKLFDEHFPFVLYRTSHRSTELCKRHPHYISRKELLCFYPVVLSFGVDVVHPVPSARAEPRLQL